MRAEGRRVRLGRRQIEVLRDAAAGKAYAHHAGQGRMVVGEHPESVLERLLDLGLVAPGRERIAGYDLVLTDAGREALATVAPTSHDLSTTAAEHDGTSLGPEVSA